MPKMYDGSIDEVIKTLNSIQRQFMESIFLVRDSPKAKNYIKQTEKEIEVLEYAINYLKKGKLK